MAWHYNQSTGRLTRNGAFVGTGYSGKGQGYNNPLLDQVPNVGPIPRGTYRIGRPTTHPAKGPLTMSLTPIGHDAHGRTGFLLHGESIAHPGAASEGCIVLKRVLRQRICDSGDATLEVE